MYDSGEKGENSLLFCLQHHLSMCFFPKSVPAVCTTKFETVQSLVTALGENVPHSDRRQALLILNNLCIPTENKAAILFGEPAEPLLNTLLSILRHRLAESYLAAVTLLNLSYLQDDHAKTMLFTYVPIPDEQEDAIETYSHQLPVDNPISLIRTLESVLKEFVGYVGRQPKTVVYSVEQQCCRWSMNVIRNLVTVPEHALTVGTKTVIPAVAAECLSHADTSNLSQVDARLAGRRLPDAAGARVPAGRVFERAQRQ